MILSKKRITKALIRLRGCTGWSVPVFFANPGRQVFSRRGPYILSHVAQSEQVQLQNQRSQVWPLPGPVLSWRLIMKWFLWSISSFLYQERLLSVTSKSMCTKYNVLLNPLVKLAEENSVLRLTDDLDMTIAVDWDIKPQTKQINYHILFTGLDKQFFSVYKYYNCKYFNTHHFNIFFVTHSY